MSQTSSTYKFDKLEKYSFEMGEFRPPSEGRSRSLLLKATRGCSWNRCKFCISTSKKRPKFELRKVEDIKEDIDTVRAIADEIKAASWKLGYAGQITQDVIYAIIRGNPETYNREAVELPELERRLQCLLHIADWLDSGAKTVFLPDSNSIIMRTPDLVEVLRYLKEIIPSVDRVTSYGRSKTFFKKSLEELRELHEAGLSRIHAGFESGYDEVLKFIDKGITAEEQIIGGKKAIEAGISLSVYVMPGLGGKKWSVKHALESARVLNEINPDFIRIRSLTVRRDSPLFELCETGEFEPLSEEEMIDEIGRLIENLDCNSYVASDHMWNLIMDVEGQLPEDKGEMLDIVKAYQIMPLMDKLKFNLMERIRHWGAPDTIEMERLVQEAWESIQNESPDAVHKVKKATLALKQRPS